MKIKCVNKVRDNKGNIKKYQLVTEHGQKFEATAQQIKAEMKAKHYEFVNLQLSSDNRLIDKNFAALNIPENHKNPVFSVSRVGYNLATGKFDHFLVYDSIHHRHSWSIWDKYKPTAKFNPYNNLSVVNGELRCELGIVKMTPAMIKTAKLPDLMYKIVLDSKANKWLNESTKEWEDYRIINTNINGFNVFALVDSCGRVGAQGFTLEDCIVNTCKRLGLKVPKLK